ncbi:MAG: metallophosphoesterase [Chryseolinea sp.]
MNTSRRKFIKYASLGSVVTSLLPVVPSAGSPQAKSARRALRIAHITDVHILDQRNAEESFARVVADINALPDRPDLILNTGDTVMDENKQTKETVATRWDTWRKLTQSNKIKIYSSLGNHDVWNGPNEALDTEYKKEKRYGKQWAMEMLSMPERFYSFETKGWQFIALDSINGNEGYGLDDAQFEWLQGELKRIDSKRPICVFNHVPIMSIGAMLYLTQRTPIADVKFPAGDMHLDHQRIKNLFFKHKNVKLCLSGHVHYIDSIDYLGVKYMCNGAVSGNWWRDSFVLDEFPPVYSIIDLYDDGSSECQSVYYKYQV